MGEAEMIKTLRAFLAAVMLAFAGTAAWAAFDVNTATQAQFEQVKGIGPVKAKAIIDERTKNGPFKSVEDLQKRTTGIGPATLDELKAAGATVGGVAIAAPAKAAPAKAAAPSAPAAAAPVKAAAPVAAAGKDAKPTAEAKKDAGKPAAETKKDAADKAGKKPAETAKDKPEAKKDEKKS
jgi:competence protein ComEA